MEVQFFIIAIIMNLKMLQEEILEHGCVQSFILELINVGSEESFHFYEQKMA